MPRHAIASDTNQRATSEWDNDLTAAVGAIGSTETDLVLSANITVTGDLTIPENITLYIPKGKVLSINSPDTLTIEGAFNAGIYEVFGGTGSIVFGDGAVSEVYPEWFGAVPDGTDMSQEIQLAIDSVAEQQGGVVRFTGRQYTIYNTIDLTNCRAITLMGEPGHHLSTFGTVFTWYGSTSDIMMNIDGLSFSEIANLTFDGRNVANVTGIQVNTSGSVATQLNTIRNCVFARLDIGIHVGDGVSTQTNNDSFLVERCWFRESNTGVLFNCDQAILWNFLQCQWLTVTDGITTGDAAPYSGGFMVSGGSMLATDTCFNIPRVNSNIAIRDLHIENCQRVVSHSSSTGNSGRTISLENVWQNSVQAGYDYSIQHETNNNLIVSNSRLVKPVEVGRLGTSDTPFSDAQVSHRTFINCKIEDPDAAGYKIKRLVPASGEYTVNVIGESDSALISLDDGDTTPSVIMGDSFRTANTAPTTITTFDDGHLGKQISVIVQDENTTIDFTSPTLRGNGNASWTTTSGDFLTATFDGGEWKCATSAISTSSDVELTASGFGVTMFSPDATKWRIQVDDGGNLTTTVVV